MRSDEARAFMVMRLGLISAKAPVTTDIVTYPKVNPWLLRGMRCYSQTIVFAYVAHEGIGPLVFL